VIILKIRFADDLTTGDDVSNQIVCVPGTVSLLYEGRSLKGFEQTKHFLILGRSLSNRRSVCQRSFIFSATSSQSLPRFLYALICNSSTITSTTVVLYYSIIAYKARSRGLHVRCESLRVFTCSRGALALSPFYSSFFFFFFSR